MGEGDEAMGGGEGEDEEGVGTEGGITDGEYS